MTYRQLKAALEPCAGPGEDAGFEALQLLTEYCGVSRASVLCEPDKDYSDARLETAVKLRRQGEPLQYILGRWDFMGLPFRLTRDCLVPRADTEILCQRLIELLSPGDVFADLCTGSGCIGVAALKLTEDTVCTAVEKYRETLDIAGENARMNGVESRFVPVLADALEDCLYDRGPFDVIVSNPPYISLKEMEDIPADVATQPRRALTDEGDGLSFYKAMLGYCPGHIRPGGRLLFEIGWKQAQAVGLLAKAEGFESSIIKDCDGRDRVCEIYIK